MSAWTTHLGVLLATAHRPSCCSVAACRIELHGYVQGIGFRPAISRLATQFNLTGWIQNTAAGVSLHLEGPLPQLREGLTALPAALPREASITELHGCWIEPAGCASFTISREPVSAAPQTPVPLDRSTCADCLEDVTSPSNRRRDYPFTTCTICGPRYSIIESLPFERSSTTMASFRLCPVCEREVQSFDDRRHHAQTIACPECGPHLELHLRQSTHAPVRDVAAIDRAAQVLTQGGLIAICGLGGYQLLAEATDVNAVARLRELKQRPAKPFAILVRDLEAARRFAIVDAAAARALTDPSNPIVLLPQRLKSSLPHNVSGGRRTIGIMLPTTPAHHLLARLFPNPLIVTSGNLKGFPLAATQAEAEAELGPEVNALLHHNRPIAHRIDDSVVRVVGGGPLTIRAARGLAPQSLSITSKRSILAVGGHQKVAIAIANGRQAALGPHVGDLDSLAMRERFVDHVRELTELYRFSPDLLVADQHPEYFTTRWGLAHSTGSPRLIGPGNDATTYAHLANAERAHGSARSLCASRVLLVQHHHAHVAAGMLETTHANGQVLGIAWDGTGWGPDGTIWGGEFLLCTLTGYQRVGRLLPFPLLGGEQAVRQPWRVALALLTMTIGAETAIRRISELFPHLASGNLTSLARSSGRAVLTSSVGRLFDGVAALVHRHEVAAYEGQAAELLEDRATDQETVGYEFPIVDHEHGFDLDWRPAVTRLIEDIDAGVSPSTIAARFHHGLALAVADIARRFPAHHIVLCGGVFQNRLLAEAALKALENHPAGVTLPRRIPINDGGLAAGQLAIAAALMKE